MLPNNEGNWRKRYLQALDVKGTEYSYWSLKTLAIDYEISLSKLPFITKLLLENVMSHYDTETITSDIVATLCLNTTKHKVGNKSTMQEFCFYPSRVLMQDYTGVPALVDLAAMRDTIAESGGDPASVNPVCPVDLVIDHSVVAEQAGTASALMANRKLEMQRNRERYQFLKWSQRNFKNLTVIPPGRGICHQVNLEYLAQIVREEQGILIPDTLVGTDSHTTMVNGLGVLGWGVGGIEAEAVMLGQPVSINMPCIVGVCLEGDLRAGVTATDLVLTLTEKLRLHGVVGKYVEYYGSGVANLSVADRATISNMAPEYGATCGIFPIDEKVIEYLTKTNRSVSLINRVKIYAKEQELWWDKNTPYPNYHEYIQVDLSTIEPSVAGPKRPQDRIGLSDIKASTLGQYSSDDDLPNTRITHGDVVLAAITSCTNTSNPAVMLTAGLVAKAAVEKGLTVPAHVKTSLAPGSLAVSMYLNETGLQHYLDRLGFHRIGYGCTTCIGNSGPLNDFLESDIRQHNLNVCAVLSGNRNFEGRIHPSVRLNWLASPPLVVAFALVGHTRIDLQKEPMAKNDAGEDIYLKDLWPSEAMLKDALAQVHQDQFRLSYQNIEQGDEEWQGLTVEDSLCYPWDSLSTYIQRPPFFEHDQQTLPIESARILAILGDSISTDHISPAGRIVESSPAGQYLIAQEVAVGDFNSYGSRRGNHEVMVRGTFANASLKNQMVEPAIGGVTCYYGDVALDDCNMSISTKMPVMPIYEASQLAISCQIPLVVFAGKEYGTGSSRDWAAKGCLLLNVRAVIAESFERIHRSNLVGMGILPLQVNRPDELASLTLKGNETIFIVLNETLKPLLEFEIIIVTDHGSEHAISVTTQISNYRELEYFNAGGILRYITQKNGH